MIKIYQQKLLPYNLYLRLAQLLKASIYGIAGHYPPLLKYLPMKVRLLLPSPSITVLSLAPD